MTNENYWLKFGAKLTISVGLSLVMGPVPAMIAGASTFAVAKTAENLVEDKDAKEVFNFISDCGGDVAIGGVLGGVGNLITAGSSTASSVNTVVKESVKYQARKEAGKQAGQWAAKKIAEGGSKELIVNIARKQAAQKAAEIISKKLAQETAKAANKQLVATIVKGIGEGTYKIIKDNKEKVFSAEEVIFHSEHCENGIEFQEDCRICLFIKKKN